MNKFLIYTPNLEMMPKTMEDVIEFAKENNKFRIANVELNSTLSSVKAGDQIITGKGNVLYVIKAIAESSENWSDEIRTYVDSLTREYGLKKMNITSVDQVVKFETWCKNAKVLVKPTNNNNKKEMKGNSFKNMTSKLKDMFMPKEVSDVRIATDGNICVETADGYVAIDSENHLISYPSELTLDLPVFVLSKPVEQLAEGDVIATERSYAKVTKIDGQKISAIGYTGTGKVIHTIKDFLFNQTMVRVVVSMAGNIGGQINPMMLMLLSGDEEKKDSLLPLLMMQQNNGVMGMNPMMFALLSGDGEKSSFKDLAMISMMSGNNLFGNMFAAPAPAAAAAVTPTK